jgi:hypothetical protein
MAPELSCASLSDVVVTASTALPTPSRDGSWGRPLSSLPESRVMWVELRCRYQANRDSNPNFVMDYFVRLLIVTTCLSFLTYKMNPHQQLSELTEKLISNA